MKSLFLRLGLILKSLLWRLTMLLSAITIFWISAFVYDVVANAGVDAWIEQVKLDAGIAAVIEDRRGRKCPGDLQND